MGALFGGNADRQWGYKIGDKIVPPSIDRIDGGGPGRSGPRFEGGGLLSDIGNALMRPYGYRDRQAAMQAMRPNARPQGLLTTAPARATEADYADRFAPTAVMATEPDYADRFAPVTAPRPDYMDEDQVMAQELPSRLPAGLPREIIMTPEMHSFLRARFPERQLSPIGALMDPSEISSIRNLRGASYDRPRVAGSEGAFPAAAPATATATATAKTPFFDYLIKNGLPRDIAEQLADPKKGVGKRLRDTYATHGTLGPRAIGYLQWRYGNN